MKRKPYPHVLVTSLILSNLAIAPVYASSDEQVELVEEQQVNAEAFVIADVREEISTELIGEEVPGPETGLEAEAGKDVTNNSGSLASKLPQTGSMQSYTWGIMGMIGVLLSALFIVARKRKNPLRS